MSNKITTPVSFQVKACGKRQAGGVSLIRLSELLIESKIKQGKVRTAETYKSAISSFVKFWGGDISLSSLSTAVVLDYQNYLLGQGLCRNTSSFYLRNLRAIYNRAVDMELVGPSNPFRRVYTGIAKTDNRALTLRELRVVRSLDLSYDPKLEFARDIFLFSFYTRGMSLVDVAFLTKSNISHGVLSYKRRKTGQLIYIRWEKCMQELVDRYHDSDSPYLLPIVRCGSSDPRKQYLNVARKINRQLKQIREKMGLPIPLTMYVARHSWASIARASNIPVSVISQALGHDSEKTTRIYLNSLEKNLIDDANMRIISKL